MLCQWALAFSRSENLYDIMLGSIKNQFEKKCPKCGKTIIIKEINDGSPMRTYDSGLCPECGEMLHEDYIVGCFETEVKS